MSWVLRASMSVPALIERSSRSGSAPEVMSRPTPAPLCTTWNAAPVFARPERLDEHTPRRAVAGRDDVQRGRGRGGRRRRRWSRARRCCRRRATTSSAGRPALLASTSTRPTNSPASALPSALPIPRTGAPGAPSSARLPLGLPNTAPVADDTVWAPKSGRIFVPWIDALALTSTSRTAPSAMALPSTAPGASDAALIEPSARSADVIDPFRIATEPTAPGASFRADHGVRRRGCPR